MALWSYTPASSNARLALAAATLLLFPAPSAAFVLRADKVIIGQIATWGTFAVLYFVALIINIICMFKVDGHRAPYGVLIPVQILLAFACLANTALTIFDNIDQIPPTRAYAGVQAVSSLFTNWGLALLFFALVLVVRERQDRYRALTKRDSIVLGQRVMVTIAGSHLLFSIVFGLGTTTGVMATNAYNALSDSGERFEKRYDTYRNTLYASQAFYYITAGALIYLAHSLFKLMRSTHVADTVTKTLLFVVSPLYVLHILVMMSYLIVFNQTGPLPDFNKTSLMSCIMQNTLLFFTILVVLILGLRPSAWKLEVENKGTSEVVSSDTPATEVTSRASPALASPTDAGNQVYRGPSTRSRVNGSVDVHTEESAQTVVQGRPKRHRRGSSAVNGSAVGGGLTSGGTDSETDRFTRMPTRKRPARAASGQR